MAEYKYQALLDRIKESEGFRAGSYRDSLGKLTIGYGWLLEEKDGGEPLPEGFHEPLTEPEAEQLAKRKINEKAERLSKLKPFNGLDIARQEILIDCAYQIGVGGLIKFRKMWAALAAGDYNEAADQMLDSKVAREQTPARWQEHARRMREGATGEPPAKRVQDDIAARVAAHEATQAREPGGDEEYAGDSLSVRAKACYEAAQALGLTRTNKSWGELTDESKMRWSLFVSGHLLASFNKA